MGIGAVCTRTATWSVCCYCLRLTCAYLIGGRCARVLLRGVWRQAAPYRDHAYSEPGTLGSRV
eukprot:113781-Rhodomonas_salina.1